MKKTLFIAMFAMALASPALAQGAASGEATAVQASAAAAAVVPVRRELLLSSDGERIGRVDRLADDGAPRVIYHGRLLTIPLSTLSRADGALTTSLTRREVLALD